MSNKKLLVITIFSFFSLIVTLFSLPQNHTRLIVCDVGQGDAILVTKGTTQVLIDGGPSSEKILSCLSRYVPFWDRTLELIAFTNTDSDHLGGLSAVLQRYQVRKIVTGDGIGESKTLAQFVATLRQTNHHVEQLGQGDVLIIGALHFRVLWPNNPNPAVMTALNDYSLTQNNILGANVIKNTNERSLVLLLEDGKYKALFTGDIGYPTETSLIQQALLPDIDILKVGHHGSKYSSSYAFLSTLKPEVSLISVGHNNYGHPTNETLTRLREVGSQIRRTDQEGDLVLTLK